ncbi:MAG: carboxypeptidase-like regulatory domain-containing protein [Conexivisphaerales archaeon]
MGAISALVVIALLIVSIANNSPLTSPPPLQSNSTIISNSSFSPSVSFTGGLQIPYVTYQFASWGGGGWSFGQGVTDMQMQEQQSMASLILPWEGRAGWCSNANTSFSKITLSDPIYGSSTSSAIQRYQTPFLIQEPLDSYGTECVQWGQQVVKQYPNLITYDYNGTPLTASRMSAIGKDYVRVDTLDFSKQIYNDLVNIYNNMRASNPALISYWYGIEVGPGIYADHGDLQKPGASIVLGSGFATDYYWSNQTVINFANSPQCTQHYSNCATLVFYATGGANTRAIANTIANNDAKWFGLWLDYQLFLGLSYATYNFTQNYHLNHPFFIHASYDYAGVSLQPSSYPFPYNTSYIENLNLFNNYVMNGVLDFENGNPPTSVSVSYDESVCRNHINQANTINGFLVTGTYPNVRNMIYLEAYCAATSIMEPGNLPYNNPSNPMIGLLMSYGLLLNRMAYVGVGGNYAAPISANDPSTGVTVLGGKGAPLLLWFYTNSTSGDRATINLNLNNYNIGQNGWIAVSALDWSVVGRGSGTSFGLSINIPSQGWNPVYVFNTSTASISLLYTNLRLNISNLTQNSAEYFLTGPHAFSGWAILHVASKPQAVTSSNSGQIPEYQTLQSLNSSHIGMFWNGNSWSNRTETGWYYDTNNQLLYVHFVGDNAVTLTVTLGNTSQTGSLTISPSQSSVTLTQGNSTSLSLNVNSYRVASQKVSLSAFQLPNGLGVTFSPSTAYTNFTSSLYVTASSSMQPGIYTVILQANSSTLLATAILSISVLAAQSSTGSGQQQNNTSGSGEVQSGGSGSNGNDNMTQQNQQQYYTLTIASGPAGFGSTEPQSGSYQLPAGSMINIAAKPIAGWVLESWFVNGNYAGNGSMISFPLTSDTTVLALFGQSAIINNVATISFESNQPDSSVMIDGRTYLLPVSFSWVIDSAHNISALPLISVSKNEQIRFVGWAGGIKSDDSNITIRVQNDVAILAQYSSFYRVNLSFIDAQKSRVVPTEVLLSYSQGIIQLENNFSFWSLSGVTYTLLGAEWGGTSVAPITTSNATFTVESPSTIVFGLNIHSDTIRVQDVFGQPIKNAYVSLILPNGTEIHVLTNASGYAYFPQLPPDGYQMKISYLGATLPINPSQQSGGIEYVTLALSYPVVGGIIGLAISLGLSLSFSKLKRFMPAIFRGLRKQIEDAAESQQ